MKILHTGDVHFDNPPQLLAEVVTCTDYLLGAAQTEAPDLIVVAGDTFNDTVELGSPASLAAMDFIQRCALIAPTLVIRGTSTHDAEGSVNALAKLRGRYPIFVTDRLCQVAFTGSGFIEVDGIIPASCRAIISCLPSVSKAVVASACKSQEESNRDTTDLLRDVLQGWGAVNSKASCRGAPAILVGHLTVTGSRLPTGQQMVGRELELTVGDLRLAGAKLVCLGHIHKAQSWGEVFYCGSITRLNHGEANDEKGFFVHDVLGESLSSKFVETPARVMKTYRPAAIPTVEDVADVQPGEFIRLVYEISEDNLARVDEKAIIQAALAKGAADVKIEKVIVPKNTMRAEGISTLRSIREKLDRWAELNGVSFNGTTDAKIAVLESGEDPRGYFAMYREAS